MDAVKAFIKKETVLCAAVLVAVMSMFFVPPSLDYLRYIDFRVLILLLCLMLAVAGLRSVGVFEWVIGRLLSCVKNVRQLVFILVLSCFFASMWITNDVALLTFVPFAILVLEAVGVRDKMIFVITMQTIAANLGSMCTPIGNPQNLYLYSLAGLSVTSFLRLMFPLSAASFLLIVLAVFFVKPERIVYQGKYEKRGLDRRLYGYLFLFLLCILTVLRIMDYRMLLAITVFAVFILNRRLYKEADYMLLITFIAFFIFVGNIKNMESISGILKRCVTGHEIIVSVFASQVISNVPAAVLLSGFTSDIVALLIGTNIGGLGTLIASMASLISYKLYVGTKDSKKGRYMLEFTIWNLVFLAVLWGIALL